MLRFEAAGSSHVGLVRAGNEDAGFVGPSLLLVADGVGGAAAGEVASATSAFAVAGSVLTALRTPRVVDAGHALARGAVQAVRALAEGVRRDRASEGMGTTLTALVCDGDRVTVGHVGDSRAYRWREGRLERLTRDHTYVARLVEEGVLPAAAVSSHPWRNVVTRSLGAESDGRLDLSVVDDVRAGDRFLVCSDGLSDLVSEERLAEVLSLRTVEAAGAVLVQSALAAGGRDNVTVAVADVVEGPTLVGDGRLLGALSDPSLVVDLALRAG